MINLNDFRENIYQNEGLRECPHYGEDGVILKIFEIIKPNKKPLIIEFGETRSLGTSTRSFRIKFKSRSIYFTGDLTLKSTILNILDIFKITFKRVNIFYLKFLINLPFKFFVTPNNIIDLLKNKKVNNIDILTIDIDSYDYYIAKEILSNNYLPVLLILEYNYNLGYEKSLTLPYPTKDSEINKIVYGGLDNKINKRVYGASFNALYNLATSYNYKLVHISGFCNLFFIRHDYQHLFSKPDLNKDLIRNNEDINIFLKNYCQKGFYPSWYNEKALEDSDLKYFKSVE
jgi:hypothetical protein